MKKGLWAFISKPENLSYTVTILIAVVVGILGILRVVPIEVLIAAVVLVLGTITWILVVFHSSVRNFQQELENPRLEKVIRPFSELETDELLRMQIKDAKEIWLLSRTGQGIVGITFREELDFVIMNARDYNTPRIRLLFLDPQTDKNSALTMVAQVQEKFAISKEWVIRVNTERAQCFLDYLKTTYGSRIELKVIDYLPAWTLLIINPHSRDANSIAYVELATYEANERTRPTLKITPADIKYFDMFIKEFNKMSDAARPWELAGTRAN